MEKLDFFTPHVLNTHGEGLYQEAFENYMAYIDTHKEESPSSLFEHVKSSWYFNASDSKCPKDAWVMNINITNDYCTKTKNKLPAKVTITLLGAYHDQKIHFRYEGVENAEVIGVAGSMSDRDYDSWRIDEFSVNANKSIRHKICFLSGNVWTIDFKELIVDFQPI